MSVKNRDSDPQVPGVMPNAAREGLRRSLHENIDSARAHVERSHEIVSHARELIARVKRSLAQAQRLQDDQSRPGNPPIRARR